MGREGDQLVSPSVAGATLSGRSRETSAASPRGHRDHLHVAGRLQWLRGRHPWLRAWLSAPVDGALIQASPERQGQERSSRGDKTLEGARNRCIFGASSLSDPRNPRAASGGERGGESRGLGILSSSKLSSRALVQGRGDGPETCC